MKKAMDKFGMIISIPEGDNRASSITNFYDRRDFDDLIPTGLLDNTIDLRSQRALYGRVNLYGDAVYPDIDEVSFDPVTKLFGFNFAKILIGQFITEWITLSFLPTYLPNSAIYKRIQVTNNKFQSVDEAFTQIYSNIFDTFHKYLFETGVEFSVLNFDAYATTFARFLRNNVIDFTREKLIKTSAWKSYNTLLVYDLQQRAHGSDEETYEIYYLDPSIKLMSDTLLRHGLVLDRHSPWRFAINLRSPQVTTPSEDRTFVRQAQFKEGFIEQLIEITTTPSTIPLTLEEGSQIVDELFRIGKDGNPLSWVKRWHAAQEILSAKYKETPIDNLYGSVVDLYNSAFFNGTTAESLFAGGYIRAYTTEINNAKKLLTTSYNIFVEKAFQKRIAECPDTHKPIQLKPDRKKYKGDDDIELTILNFLLSVREAEEEITIPFTTRQAAYKLLQTKQGVQKAYKKLHEAVKRLKYKKITPFMTHGDALLWANHVGCNGAHQMTNGSWRPCKSHADFISLTSS